MSSNPIYIHPEFCYTCGSIANQLHSVQPANEFVTLTCGCVKRVNEAVVPIKVSSNDQTD